jgi:hypothetical protein
MVMTFDNGYSHYITDAGIPQANLTKLAPVNYINVKAHPDDVEAPSGTHIHIHSVDELALPDHDDRISTLEQAVLRLIREYAKGRRRRRGER